MALAMYDMSHLSRNDFTSILRSQSTWCSQDPCLDDRKIASRLFKVMRVLMANEQAHKNYLCEFEILLKYGDLLPVGYLKLLVAEFANLSILEQNRIGLLWIMLIRYRWLQILEPAALREDKYRVWNLLFPGGRPIDFEVFLWLYDKMGKKNVQKVVVEEVGKDMNTDMLTTEEVSKCVPLLFGCTSAP